MKKKKNIQPLVLADVEGKGLSAALLAASCQAIFHSLNELYLFKPAKFIGKANTLIHEITNGSRFITLFWMLLNDEIPALTYVNAGHNQPYLISGTKVSKLSEGGFLIGFSAGSDLRAENHPAVPGRHRLRFYRRGFRSAESPTARNSAKRPSSILCARIHGMTAAELSSGLYKKIKEFC